MSNHDRKSLDLLALKIRAGLALPPEDQAHWDAHASLQNKVAAGLPLSPEEQTKWERIRNIRTVVRAGVIVTEDASAPQTVDEWKKVVAASRAAPVKLVADSPLENKPQT
jgi:hypothetical protein